MSGPRDRRIPRVYDTNESTSDDDTITVARGSVPGELPRPEAFADTTPDGAPAARVELRGVPDMVGSAERYRVKSVLGEGGMGEVRLCHDEVIGREVALKVMRPELADDDLAIPRFLREARVQGQLEHPAVVPVHDLGVTPEGSTFFTMKRVRGVTLETVLEKLADGDAATMTRFTLRKLLAAMVSVCLAVDFAHKRGVLHRDLKPSNIMLGEFGEVYVLDWGVAKVADEDDELTETIVKGRKKKPTPAPVNTVAGAIMGTAGYMAPEQIQSRKIDARSDVFALGAILFEVLTLEFLIQGSSYVELTQATVRGVDARPTVRRPDLNIAPELETICVKATALAKGARYESARAMSDAIEAYLEGDQDLEMRRELAAAHAMEADKALARGLADTPNYERARVIAMRELGHALTLDPTNRKAIETLRTVLTETPKEPPAEVLRTIRASELVGKRFAARMGAIIIAAFAATLPLLLWMNVNDYLGLGLAIVPVLVAIYLLFTIAKKKDPPLYAEAGVVALIALGLVFLGRLFSPLLLVPTLAVSLSAATQAHPDAPLRLVAKGLCCASVVVPIALETVGILPPTFTLSGSTLRIHMPGNVAGGPTIFYFALVSTAAILLSSWYLDRLRAKFFEAEAKVHTRAWLVKQLTPASLAVIDARRTRR